MNKTKEEILDSIYASPQLFNMVYSLMMLGQLRDVYPPFMEAMKQYYIESLEFEKCENIKEFMIRLKEEAVKNMITEIPKNDKPNA